MFDRGATWVRIIFRQTPDHHAVLTVLSSRQVFTEFEVRGLEAKGNTDPSLICGQAFSHHALHRRVSGSLYEFLDIGAGAGVNPRQDRSAKRLIRTLPWLLSPLEAAHTTVIDELGVDHVLSMGLPGTTTMSGFKIDWPEKFVVSERGGLVLKFGCVRVPMSTFLAGLQMTPQEHVTLNILTHPWLHGVVELRPDLGLVNIPPIPNKPADDFDDAFYLQGHAATLGRALLEIFPAVVVLKMNKVVQDSMSHFTQDECFVLNPSRYQIVLASSEQITSGKGQVLWKAPGSQRWVTRLHLDVTHPVFCTINLDREEIMQIIWWQLAMWIAGNIPDVLTEASNPQDRTTVIYLALRAQNADRWDD